jgi:beta-lactamase regulating signal transducer with metallopeptidase domain
MDGVLYSLLGPDIGATLALGILRSNAAAAVVVLLVLALRTPIRRVWGPEAAYILWLAPLLAAFAVLMPARVSDRVLPLATELPAPAGSLLGVWLAGALIAFTLVIVAQRRFEALARAGRAGPSLIGVFTPRIVMPPDDGSYTAEERDLIRAHERTHIHRRDPAWRALCAALQCLFWFNPLIHVAAVAMRLDQELACDAAVLRPRQGAKAVYARALLKAQLAGQPAPFVCRWAAGGAHPLELRLRSLKRARTADGLMAPIFLGAAIGVTALGAWASKPPMPRAEPRLELYQIEAKSQPAMSVMIISAPARD